MLRKTEKINVGFFCFIWRSQRSFARDNKSVYPFILRNESFDTLTWHKCTFGSFNHIWSKLSRSFFETGGMYAEFCCSSYSRQFLLTVASASAKSCSNKTWCQLQLLKTSGHPCMPFDIFSFNRLQQLSGWSVCTLWLSWCLITINGNPFVFSWSQNNSFVTKRNESPYPKMLR